ncbi:EKC/KEOPS complex subunit [Seiridium cupressi]
MLETIPLEHIPSTHSVHVALFRNVTNAEFLQSQLLSRNPDFEYAFIDASTVASRFHLLSAVYKAITIEASGNMRTPNIHSEIVCSLSSNNNIAEAYRRFGIQPATKDVVVVKVLISREDASSIVTSEDVDRHLVEHVQGESVPLRDEALAKLTDWPKLRKYHKLNGVSYIEGIEDEEARTKERELLVVSAMALRGF